jgi:adenine deaminase
MELVNQTITAAGIVSFNAPSGIVEANLYDDLLKVAMFDRHHRSKQVAFGFLASVGAKVGVVGLTTNLDENTLMVVGSDDEDMALCANTLFEAGGGIAMIDAGEILELLKFPFGGMFSLHPWQEVGRGLGRIQTRLKNGLVFRQAHFRFELFTVRDFARAASYLARFSAREGQKDRSAVCGLTR